MIVFIECVCGKMEYVGVDEDRYNEWVNGKHIQVALPELSDSQREALKMNECIPCVDKTFDLIAEMEEENES